MEEVFCEHCGSVSHRMADQLEAVLDQLEAVRREATMKEEAIVLLEQDTRRLRSQNSRLRSEQNKSERLHPMIGDAEEVFGYWQKRLAPRSREFSGKRLKNVLDRLTAGASVEELKEAVDGCALLPYVVDGRRSPIGEVSQRYADLELICRSESKVDTFRSYVAVAESPPEDKAKLREYQGYVQALSRPVVQRLCDLRGWDPEVVRDLGLGLDRASARVILPVRDAHNNLVGFCRYQPNKERRGNAPKNIAEGPRELWPPPESIDTESIWLVEGEPDAIAMWSVGLPAVAVPGVATWKDGWEQRFAKFERVRICMDADEEGRECAAKRSAALASHCEVSIVELDKDREDGYDVGDLVKERGKDAATELARRSASPVNTVLRMVTRKPEANVWNGERPYELVRSRLITHDLRVQERGDGRCEAQCPNHDDRQPSLSVTEGDDRRVLLHCHAGCSPQEIVSALGLEMRELFAA